MTSRLRFGSVVICRGLFNEQLLMRGLVWGAMLLLVGCETTNKDVLRDKIEKIVSDQDAVVGVSIVGVGGLDTLSLNGDKPFPMQSVFKFHLALVVLSEIDQGRFSFDQEVTIGESELLPGLWSPLREEYPLGGTFTIAILMRYALSQSDNVACDALIGLIGGPQAIEVYFKRHGIEDIGVAFNEEAMQATWSNMFQNWTTPRAASQTLRIFFENEDNRLSIGSHDFLWKTMKESGTGVNRLKGFLPAGTVVAHKTGSSGVNDEGITAATNDVGIVFLPDGRHFMISVFVTDSKEPSEKNERIIADISKATYDHFSTIP